MYGERRNTTADRLQFGQLSPFTAISGNASETALNRDSAYKSLYVVWYVHNIVCTGNVFPVVMGPHRYEHNQIAMHCKSVIARRTEKE